MTSREPKPRIVEDVLTASEWIAHALCEAGYLADFSPESLSEIDRFLDEHSSGGAPKDGGLLTRDLGVRLFGLGGYLGEVLRRQLGGEWEGDDDDPHAEVNITLKLGNGSLCWPVQRVLKRYREGASESVAAYLIGLRSPPLP